MSFMTGSTGGQVNNSLAALFAVNDVPGSTSGQQLIINSFTARDEMAVVPADAGATSTAAVPLLVTRQNYTVRAAYYIPSTAVTANASNYATITLAYTAMTGGSATTLATFSTATNSIAAGAAATLVLASPAVIIPATSIIVFTTTKAGTGVSLPLGVIDVVLDIV